mgnify:CR=1 FL=1
MVMGALKGVGKAFDKTQQIFTGTPFKDMSTVGKMVTASPAVYFGGKEIGYDMAIDPMVKSITNEKDHYARMIDDARSANQQHQVALRTRVEIEELQKKIARSAMRLAAIDPHLYNEVMAGRSLPKDAVVFGGQPRTDLMEELAMGMAQGQFEKPQTAHDELMQSLGV